MIMSNDIHQKAELEYCVKAPCFVPLLSTALGSSSLLKLCNAKGCTAPGYWGRPSWFTAISCGFHESKGEGEREASFISFLFLPLFLVFPSLPLVALTLELVMQVHQYQLSSPIALRDHSPSCQITYDNLKTDELLGKGGMCL